MKSFTSIVGWLLLVTLIAVPSFLFYNWVMQGRDKAAAETTSGPAINVFPPSQDRPAPAPVAAAAPAAQTEPEKGAGPAETALKAAPKPAEPTPSASSNPPAEQGQPAPAATPAAVSTPAAQGQAVAVEVSTAPKPRSWFSPKSERDPTMTPEDYRRIRDEQLRMAEAQRMAQNSEQNKPREPGPETRITLQGIVGNAAIINGDMYTAGQVVRGVKILKVGADYINCEAVSGAYKGKKFRKVMR